MVYVSFITPSLIWKLTHLQKRGRADRTTVVFDRPAILNKALHSGIHEDLPRLAHGDVLWQLSKKRSAEEDVDALRAELEKAFTVVLADAFETEVPALQARILAASSALPPGARETHLEFRFHPALDDAALEHLRQVDAALWREIDPEGTRDIDCMPYRLNQVHLRIFTSLLFGAHDEAGRALAVYAGIMDAALDLYTQAGRIDERVSAEESPKHLAMLKDHCDTAASIAWSFLSVGKSHEFGDYGKLATATCDRIFAASRERAGRFGVHLDAEAAAAQASVAAVPGTARAAVRSGSRRRRAAFPGPAVAAAIPATEAGSTGPCRRPSSPRTERAGRPQGQAARFIHPIL